MYPWPKNLTVHQYPTAMPYPMEVAEQGPRLDVATCGEAANTKTAPHWATGQSLA